MVQKCERDEKESIRHLPYFFLTLKVLKTLRGLGMYFNRFLSISTGK